MAYCLNPGCPHKKKTGNPAEFQEGITHCSDCGSLLSEEVIEKEDTQKTTPRITLTDLHKRVLYTIGFVVLWRVLILIPAPGIDLQALGSFFNDETALGRLFGYAHVLERFSICALGIMPYLSAYMFVEILSLFIQPLKSWRKEGDAGRTKLKKIALFATILLALLAGFGNVISFENMQGPTGETIALASGWFSRIITVITLTAGTFIMIWIADLITRKGIGHGISVLILAAFGQDIVSGFPRIISVYYQRSPLGYFLMITAVVIALMALILLMEKGYRRISVKYDDGIEAYIPLKFTSAGITPVYPGLMLIGLPITIFGFLDYEILQKLSHVLIPGRAIYFIVYTVVIIFLYYLLTSFFYNPKKMDALFKKRQASIVSPSGEKEEGSIDRSLEATIPIAALYLCLAFFAPYIILRFFDFHLSGLALITAVAILLDLIEEMNIRRKGSNLVKVAELHDVPMAGLLKSLFEQKGLPCYLRGYYHRALLYFFGPYIEISVLVPEDKMTDAKEVIENYLDANMLTVHFQ